MRDQIVAHVVRDASPALAAEARALVKKKGNLADQLVAAGFAPGKVLEACCAVTGLPPAAIAWLKDPRVPSGVDVDGELCRRLGCAPVARAGGKLCIAYADPEIAAGADTLGFPEHAAYLALSSQLARAMALLPEGSVEATNASPRPDLDAARNPRVDELDDATAALDPIEAAATARAAMHVKDDSDDDPLAEAPTIKQARPAEAKAAKPEPSTPKPRPKASVAGGPEPSTPKPRPKASVDAAPDVSTPKPRPKASVDAAPDVSTAKPRPKASADAAPDVSTPKPRPKASADAAPDVSTSKPRPKTKPAVAAPPELPPEPPPVEMPLEDLLVAPPVLPVASGAPLIPSGQETPVTSEAAPWGAFQSAEPKPKPAPPPPPRVPTRSTSIARDASDSGRSSAPPPPPPMAAPSFPPADDRRPFGKKAMTVASFREVESSMPAKRPVEGSLPAKRPTAGELGLDPFVPPPSSGAGGTSGSMAKAPAMPPAPGRPGTKPGMQAPFIPGIDDVAPPVEEKPAKKPKKAWNAGAGDNDGSFVEQLKAAKTQLFAAGGVVLIIVVVALLSHLTDAKPGTPAGALPSLREGEGKLDLTTRQLELVAKGKSEKDDELARKLFSQAIAMNPNAPGARDAFLERARRSIAMGDAVQADLDISVLRRRGDVDGISNDMNALIQQLGELKAHPKPRVAPAAPGAVKPGALPAAAPGVPVPATAPMPPPPMRTLPTGASSPMGGATPSAVPSTMPSAGTAKGAP